MQRWFSTNTIFSLSNFFGSNTFCINYFWLFLFFELFLRDRVGRLFLIILLVGIFIIKICTFWLDHNSWNERVSRRIFWVVADGTGKIRKFRLIISNLRYNFLQIFYFWLNFLLNFLKHFHFLFAKIPLIFLIINL